VCFSFSEFIHEQHENLTDVLCEKHTASHKNYICFPHCKYQIHTKRQIDAHLNHGFVIPKSKFYFSILLRSQGKAIIHSLDIRHESNFFIY
jgi:hypothetical protein